MALVNPFKPTAGAEPPTLIGRDDILEDFREGLESGVGAPARLMRITGPRGSGKTVLLTELGNIARNAGWAVVDETAHAGLVDSLKSAVQNRRSTKDISVSASVALADASITLSNDPAQLSLRSALNTATAKLTKKGKGLLITLDEAQDASAEDIREIAVAVQHLIREKRNIAFVFAGVTTGVMSLLDDDGVTFLRRAKAEELAPIPTDEVASALQATIEQGGMTIEPDALEHAASTTEGYAYLIQLVGFNIWRAATRRAGKTATVTLTDAKTGTDKAIREFESTVLMSAVNGLPKTAMEYLLAMAEDELASSTGELATRLGMPANALSGTRQLLISRQVIEPSARGYVMFSIPFLREFLVGNRATLLARYGIAE